MKRNCPSKSRRPKFFVPALIASAAAASPLAALADDTCYTPETRLSRVFNGSSGVVSVIAHRGIWGDHNYTGATTPENSYDAVVAAGTDCMDAIELDVKMSSDGWPVIMHDYNLGRTTNVWTIKSGATTYNPLANTGYNPLVSAYKVDTLTTLKLLAPKYRFASTNYGIVTANGLPSVWNMIAAWNALPAAKIAPLIWDVKTAAAVRSINAIAKALMSSPGNRMAMKVNASLYQSRSAYTVDAPYIKGIPIFVTNNLGNIDIDTVYKNWVGGTTDAVEINVKSTNGILQGELNTAKADGIPYGVFHAVPDYPGSSMYFYNNDGSCCYTLADKYYTYKGVTEPGDNRGNSDYIYNQGFTFVTTDDPRNMRLYMAGKGKH